MQGSIIYDIAENVYGTRELRYFETHLDKWRKVHKLLFNCGLQPPFVGYMIRELYYNRKPIFHSDGKQRRDYIYIDDLINLAIAVQKTEGFDCVNVSSNQNYSVNELYEIACDIVGRKITAEYASDSHYWEKYPQLFNGIYKIRSEILNHEINKFTLADNSLAKEKYGWTPQVSITEGLKRVIDYEFALFDRLSHGKS